MAVFQIEDWFFKKTTDSIKYLPLPIDVHKQNKSLNVAYVLIHQQSITSLGSITC